MLQLFTYTEVITKENNWRLFPLISHLILGKGKNKLDRYFSLVENINDADILVVPLDINIYYKERKEAELFEMIQAFLRTGKVVWAYSSGDFGKSLDLPVYTFRLGGFEANFNNYTFILPAFIQNPYKQHLKKHFFSLEKEKSPRIGFAGHANGSILKFAKELLYYAKIEGQRISFNNYVDKQKFFPSSYYRYGLLKQMEKDHRFTTDFIYRKNYRAGAKTFEERRRTTLEFFENIGRNPYTICTRGMGNFSIRLYEVLAMGRIPVLIETDFRLPLPWLNWDEHCIITTEERLEEDLIEFHNSIDLHEFRSHQEKNFVFWQEKLSLEGYFKEIHDYFLQLINENTQAN